MYRNGEVIVDSDSFLVGVVLSMGLVGCIFRKSVSLAKQSTIYCSVVIKMQIFRLSFLVMFVQSTALGLALPVNISRILARSSLCANAPTNLPSHPGVRPQKS